MYRDKTRRKQVVPPEAAATGTDGRTGLVLPRSPAVEVTDVDLQRAGFGVL